MSLEEKVASLEKSVVTLTETIGNLIGSIKAGQPGRTPEEIAAATAAPAKGGKKKETAAAATTAAPAAAEEEFDPFADEPAAAPVKAFTAEQVRDALMNLAKPTDKGGLGKKAQGLAILSKFGCATVGDMKAENYAEAMAMVEAAKKA